MSRPTPDGPGQERGRPSLLAGAGHLAALWALAFAQPLFDLLGRNPDFFVARGNGGDEIVAFAIIFTLGPPLAMLAAEAAVARLWPQGCWPLHLGLVGLLCAALALQLLQELASGPAGVLIVVAIAAGAAAVHAYEQTRFARALLDVLIPAPLVVLAVFLLLSDVSDLVLPQEEVEPVSVEIPGAAPVVMVVFDELPEGTLMTPQGGIDASRFPAFAEMARESTWYRGGVTIAAFTPRAVPAILTGTLPSEDELPVASDQPRSIFTLLGGSYRMHVMENATQVCPSGLCGGREGGGIGSLFSDLRVVSEHLLLPDGLRNHLPAIDTTFGDFADQAADVPPRRFASGDPDQLAAAFADQVGEEAPRVAAFAAGIGEGDRVLHLIHVEKPHYPWNHFQDGRKYSNLSGEFKDVLADDTGWLGGEALTNLALQRHILETGFTDLLLGEVIDRLKRTGLWDRAVVVVLADHGGAVVPHERRRNPTPANFGQIAAVPLFIKAPGQRQPRVVDRAFCTSDVLPEVARLLRIDYPWRRHSCPPDEVTVANSPDGETSLSFARTERLRDAYVRRIDRLFGIGNGWGPVLRFRPHPELVGRPVSSLRTSVSESTTAGVDDERRLEDVDPRAPIVLASLLRGAIAGGEPGEAVAAAVNGRIAAVGRSFDSAGSIRYSMLIPPHYFRLGGNRVDVYRVLWGRSAVELKHLGP
ncbi:MAG: sulfatase-like hydrolase/transferase [Actinomycetota bacterium]